MWGLGSTHVGKVTLKGNNLRTQELREACFPAQVESAGVESAVTEARASGPRQNFTVRAEQSLPEPGCSRTGPLPEALFSRDAVSSLIVFIKFIFCINREVSVVCTQDARRMQTSRGRPCETKPAQTEYTSQRYLTPDLDGDITGLGHAECKIHIHVEIRRRGCISGSKTQCWSRTRTGPAPCTR